jgi:hypothetical protein
MANQVGRNVLTGVVAITAAIGGAMGVSRAMHARTTGASVAAGMNVPSTQQDRFARIIDQEMSPLLNDPRFEQELQRRAGPGASQDRAREIGAELTQRGILRLTPEDLGEFTRLRLALAQRNEAVCATLWTGHGDNSQVAVALSQLDDNDLHQWLRLSTRAAVLELNGRAPVIPDQSALADGLHAITAAVQGEERTTLDTAIAAGTAAPPATGCAAIRIILREAQRLEPGLRDRFLRALSAV